MLLTEGSKDGQRFPPVSNCSCGNCKVLSGFYCCILQNNFLVKIQRHWMSAATVKVLLKKSFEPQLSLSSLTVTSSDQVKRANVKCHVAESGKCMLDRPRLYFCSIFSKDILTPIRQPVAPTVAIMVKLTFSTWTSSSEVWFASMKDEWAVPSWVEEEK